MKTKIAICAAGAALALTASALAQVADKYAGGYLAPDVLDTRKIVPPAPVAGTTRYEADRTTFLATRSLKDTARWQQAVKDADEGVIVEHYACAMGFTPDKVHTPKLYALIEKVRFDARRAVDQPKDLYKRQRPFLIDPGPTCTVQDQAIINSPDYPSGHTTWGWTVGSLLGEIVPDKVTPIMTRARSYGESRIVCGVHNASAVDAGRINAASLMVALHGSAQFRKDMDAVRDEVAKARKTLPAPQACDALNALIEPTPYR